MNLIEGLFFAFSIQAIILAFFIVFKTSTQRYQNRIWALFLFLLALNFIYALLYWVNPTAESVVFFAKAYFLLMALYGPLFYFYIRKAVNKDPVQLKKDFYHFIPFVLTLINYIRFYLLPFEKKQSVYLNGLVDSYVFVSDFTSYLILTLILIGYAWLSYRLGRRKYENDLEMKMWLNLVVISFFLFGICRLVYFSVIWLDLYSLETDYVIGFSMVLFIGLTSYFGFVHADVFNGKSLKKVFPLVKYKNSGLSKKVMVDLKEKLADLIENEQLYLNCELKLTDLADKLNISRHHASQVINESFGVSFYAYINKLRVQEAEKLLKDESALDLNITDIAFKSGFNNRVSFYNSFRKHVGVTPLEFRNKKMAAAS